MKTCNAGKAGKEDYTPHNERPSCYNREGRGRISARPPQIDKGKNSPGLSEVLTQDTNGTYTAFAENSCVFL
jgi:hypothetical protein